MGRSDRKRRVPSEGPPSGLRVASAFDVRTSGTWEREDGTILAERVHAIVGRVVDGQTWEERRGLLDELASLLSHPDLPEAARSIGMDLAGKLARRVGAETACCRGLDEMIARVRSRRS